MACCATRNGFSKWRRVAKRYQAWHWPAFVLRSAPGLASTLSIWPVSSVHNTKSVYHYVPLLTMPAVFSSRPQPTTTGLTPACLPTLLLPQAILLTTLDKSWRRPQYTTCRCTTAYHHHHHQQQPQSMPPSRPSITWPR